jgi:hypothetical protein
MVQQSSQLWETIILPAQIDAGVPPTASGHEARARESTHTFGRNCVQDGEENDEAPFR